MPVARPDSGETRVIAHLDLDCFYVQVEQRKRPELRGKPVAVVQFNPWKGGGLIAVSYEARKCGVLRSMRGDVARKVCPDIELVQVPTAHGHANVSFYRDAGTELAWPNGADLSLSQSFKPSSFATLDSWFMRVFKEYPKAGIGGLHVVDVLSRGGLLERASIDEVYLDLTEAAAARLLKDPPLTVESLSEEARKTHILGVAEDGENAMTVGEWLCQSDSPRCDALLACGALIVAELRAAVLAETQFTCSAGIGHNKMLAKLTSSMHKPAQQTIIPASYVPTLLATIPLKKIGHLGGKLGKSLVEDLGVNTPADLLQFSQLKLQELYGVNTGTWLWNVARGKHGDEVKRRDFAKSHSAGKTFAGRTALTNMDSVMYWLGEMCEELQESLDSDLEMHNRKAKLLVFHAAVHLRGEGQPAKKFPSKSGPIRYGREKMLADARILFERGLRDFCPRNKSLSPVKGGGGNKCDWAVTALSIGASGMSTVPAGVNPITSFFAAPSRSSLTEPSLVIGTPTACQTTTSTPDLEPGQTTEGMGPCSRIPSSNDLQEMAGFLSANADGTGTLEPCSSFEAASRRNLFPSDVVPDVDVQCPPTFGSTCSPVPQNNYLQTLESDGCTTCSRSSDSSANPCEDLKLTLIQCSRLEVLTSEAETCNKSEVIVTPDVRVEVEKEADGKATRVVQSRVDCNALSETQDLPPRSSGSGGISKSTAVPRLKDLWLRNVDQSSLKRPVASSNWEYKQEEIDEEVLAQLPVEIQKELRDSLKLQVRPLQRPTKRPSIIDFFPSSSK